VASRLDRMAATIPLGHLLDLCSQGCHRIYQIQDSLHLNREMYIVLLVMMMKKFLRSQQYLKPMSLLRILQRSNLSLTNENRACHWIQAVGIVAQQMNYPVQLSFENLQRLKKNKRQEENSPLDQDQMWIKRQMPRLRRRRICSPFVFLR
jgi:hypothetical protein